MLVLLAMLNRNEFPGRLSLHELSTEVAEIGRRDLRVATDIGDELSEPQQLQRMLKANPIDAWTGGRGTGGVSYFAYDKDVLSSTLSISAELVGPLQELIREIVDWRLGEYFSRPGHTAKAEFVLKATHAGGRPILFLPDRISHPDLPEGWTNVRAGDEAVSANFVKIAINVVHRPDSDDNILDDILHGWFGADAGRPGTKHQVVLRQDGPIWTLNPLGANAAGAVLYKAYKRSEIAPLFGLPYSERYWGQGFVRQGTNTFLFVTLDKTDQTEAFKYKDHFLSVNEFQWQSQNRTAQGSDAGRSIQGHQGKGITVHVFVRARAKTLDGRGAPFYYCGPVEFVSWTGEKPITVTWKLATPVPAPLWKELGVPESRTSAN